MDVVDVAVVGGGPAGSACAGRLRAAGLDVVVLDRARFPRTKPCGGWVTPGIFDALGLVPDAYARGRTLQAFTAFRTGGMGGRAVTTDYGQPVSFGVLRSEFDHYLLDRSGAPVRSGRTVSAFRQDRGEWVMDEALRAKVVVGAGGHFCPVARLLNEGRAEGSLVVAQEVEFRLDARERAGCRVLPEVPELYFCDDLRGYGWCVRKGDYLNVGLGRRDPRGLQAHVRDFVAFLSREGRLTSALPSRWLGHAYWLYEGPPRRVVGDGLLLVGDAAGLAVPSSGEGIRPAVESGLIASRTLLAANGRYTRQDLAPYGEALKTRFGPPRRRVDLPPALARPLGRLLLGDRWFTRHFVLDRWFLQRGAEAPARQAA
jgi:flavin-dependent dehydrogenase